MTNYNWMITVENDTKTSRDLSRLECESNAVCNGLNIAIASYHGKFFSELAVDQLGPLVAQNRLTATLSKHSRH